MLKLLLLLSFTIITLIIMINTNDEFAYKVVQFLMKIYDWATSKKDNDKD